VAVDLTGEQHWIGSFQSFGITGVLCGSIPLAGDSTDPILWLGYQSADYLSATERTRLVEFLDRVAGELRLRDRLVALDGKAVAAEQVNKAKGEFIAQVSHDIRSPLNNIKSILNLLHLDGKVEGNEDLLGVALHSCDSMAELVEDILDYSKFSAGRLEPRPSEFSLDELMEQVRREFSVTAKLRGLDLQIATSNPGLSGDAPLIRMDRQHLKRIVTNLVSNALKYTERGGVTLSYSRSAFDRSLVQFTVSDTGRGMTAEQVSQLFVPFTRFDVGGIEGTGLGLTVCKLLAEANGASIAVASSRGAGTTITVQLPAAVAQSKGNNENAVATGRSAIPDLIRVLVVDDDPDYSRTLSRALGSYAISVVTASSAEEALGLIQSLAPDAIVTDGNMPGGGGRMLVSTLRARGDSTPILLASGSSVSLTDQIRQECVAVLEKPLNIEQVVELIRGAVAARRVNDQAA
jgi:signal transduction histidine kinase/ActR/RegA family two-component response regulator